MQVIIVGAGAAGLFAAGTALAAGHSVTIVEHMDSPGKKLLLTGHGRCNLTNNCGEQEFLNNVRSNPRFLYSAIYALPPSAVMDLFQNSLGVPLKTEDRGRVFPQSNRAADVLDALLRYSKNADTVRGRAASLVLQAGAVAGLKLENGDNISGGAVIIATGGMSFPATGSTGDGYALARQAGHNIIQLRPSLVPVTCKGGTAARMAGLTLKNVRLAVQENGKTVFSETGDILFTHTGISGPMVLASSAYIGDTSKYAYTAKIDLMPDTNIDALDARLQKEFQAQGARSLSKSLDKLIPASMRPVVLDRWSADPEKQAGHLTKQERQEFAEIIKCFELEISGKGDISRATITAGGVDVKQVDPKTMQSKLCPGLYFAGEVLDVDAYTGGYNLHIAWCTAAAAANGLDI